MSKNVIVIVLLLSALVVILLLSHLHLVNLTWRGNSQVEWKVMSLQIGEDIILSVYYSEVGFQPKALIVIIPGFRETCSMWNTTGLPQELASKGFATVSFDLRGHGGSIRRPNGVFVSIEELSERDYNRMNFDVKAVVEIFKEYFHVNKVYLIGSDIGASLAVAYAVKDKDVKGLILISPNFESAIPFPVEFLEKYVERGGKAIFIYSREDSLSINVINNVINTVRNISGINETVGNIFYYASNKVGHGISLMLNDNKILSKILQFIDLFYVENSRNT